MKPRKGLTSSGSGSLLPHKIQEGRTARSKTCAPSDAGDATKQPPKHLRLFGGVLFLLVASVLATVALVAHTLPGHDHADDNTEKVTFKHVLHSSVSNDLPLEVKSPLPHVIRNTAANQASGKWLKPGPGDWDESVAVTRLRNTPGQLALARRANTSLRSWKARETEVRAYDENHRSESEQQLSIPQRGLPFDHSTLSGVVIPTPLIVDDDARLAPKVKVADGTLHAVATLAPLPVSRARIVDMPTLDDAGDLSLLSLTVSPTHMLLHCSSLAPALQAHTRRLIDTFPFNNELDMLEVRLNELSAVVDAHILIESAFTQYGDPKPLFFDKAKNESRFQPFLHKIVHVIVRDKPLNATGCALGWAHEWHTRDAVASGLTRLPFVVNDTDLLLMSDADELPFSKTLSCVRQNWPLGDAKIVRLRMRWTFFGFFWLNPHESQVANIRTIKVYMITVGNGQDPRVYKRWAIRNNIHEKAVDNGGWHCSWCFDTSLFQAKLVSALCGDGVRWGDYTWDDPTLRYMRKHGIWFGAETFFQGNATSLLEDPHMAPAFVRRNHERFKHLLLPEVSKDLDSHVFVPPYCFDVRADLSAQAILYGLPSEQKRTVDVLYRAWCTDLPKPKNKEIEMLKKLNRGHFRPCNGSWRQR